MGRLSNTDLLQTFSKIYTLGIDKKIYLFATQWKLIFEWRSRGSVKKIGGIGIPESSRRILTGAMQHLLCDISASNQVGAIKISLSFQWSLVWNYFSPAIRWFQTACRHQEAVRPRWILISMGIPNCWSLPIFTSTLSRSLNNYLIHISHVSCIPFSI